MQNYSNYLKSNFILNNKDNLEGIKNNIPINNLNSFESQFSLGSEFNKNEENYNCENTLKEIHSNIKKKKNPKL